MKVIRLVDGFIIIKKYKFMLLFLSLVFSLLTIYMYQKVPKSYEHNISIDLNSLDDYKKFNHLVLGFDVYGIDGDIDPKVYVDSGRILNKYIQESQHQFEKNFGDFDEKDISFENGKIIIKAVTDEKALKVDIESYISNISENIFNSVLDDLSYFLKVEIKRYDYKVDFQYQSAMNNVSSQILLAKKLLKRDSGNIISSITLQESKDLIGRLDSILDYGLFDPKISEYQRSRELVKSKLTQIESIRAQVDEYRNHITSTYDIKDKVIPFGAYFITAFMTFVLMIIVFSIFKAAALARN